jgi:hypothetical protein
MKKRAESAKPLKSAFTECLHWLFPDRRKLLNYLEFNGFHVVAGVGFEPVTF